jgi:hypothetical protein
MVHQYIETEHILVKASGCRNSCVSMLATIRLTFISNLNSAGWLIDSAVADALAKQHLSAADPIHPIAA